jgi:hypothetical protein
MAVGIHSFISDQPLRAHYVREYLEHMKAKGRTGSPGRTRSTSDEGAAPAS